MQHIDHIDLRAGLLPPPLPPRLADADARLEALAARVRHDLEILAYPKDKWVLPRHHPSGSHVYDVLIIGAGQGGLATAFALQRERVDNVLILDRAPKGREGPWVTYSRMWTLRSPKHLTSLDLGIPSLAPRSFFEVVFGEAGWHALGKWPRHTWQAYLDWYRDVLDLPVRNDARVDAIEPEGDLVAVTVNRDKAGSGERLLCRKLVLATGIEGMGDWYIPPAVRRLPRRCWTMCTDDVDSLHWRGRSVAVLGAGATAWDRAADLLELGAGQVTQYMRRPQILTANAFRYLEKAGYLRHFASMSDADKWRWIQAIFVFGQPPTQDGVNRCAAFGNFVLHPGASWTSTRELEDGRVEVIGTDGSREVFDHVFIGAGFSMDPRNRPELAAFSENIATWADRFRPPPDQQDDWLLQFPYLNRDLTFTEREPGRTPILRNIYCFNYGATVSNAHSGASLSGMKYGIEPLIHGLTYALWVEDEPEHFRITKAWAEVDTDPAPVAGHVWMPERVTPAAGD